MKEIHLIIGADGSPLAAYITYDAACEHFKELQKKGPALIITMPTEYFYDKKEWE